MANWKKGETVGKESTVTKEINLDSDVGVLMQDISDEMSNGDQSEIVTDNNSQEMNVIEKIERGMWYQIDLHRGSDIDDLGPVYIPNHAVGPDYWIVQGDPTWVPEYATNILKESRRIETRFDKRN